MLVTNSKYIFIFLFVIFCATKLHAQNKIDRIDISTAGTVDKPYPELTITYEPIEQVSPWDIVFKYHVCVSRNTFSFLRKYIISHKKVPKDANEEHNITDSYGSYSIRINSEWYVLLDQKETIIYLKKMWNALENNDEKIPKKDVRNINDVLDRILRRLEPARDGKNYPPPD